MEYKVGHTYHGFKLEREEEVKEIKSLARMFTHVKTGARLMQLDSDDPNKVFAIGFKTPPEDSTGVAHIIEHSVLCGSDKFPVKEPFVELIKGSLNTFLNAMTFPDKTIYPFASLNEKDFMNIMDIYLDAVFFPRIYDVDEILMQEGWHYELSEDEKSLSYKGVVYNEMKGVFSSPESILSMRGQQSLFDNCYHYVSGGEPKYIPDLTQEGFTKFHDKYYHPTNSYMFIYGDGNLDNQLKFIDEKYLSRFEKRSSVPHIYPTKAFDAMKEFREEYPVAMGQDTKGKTFMALNYAIEDQCNDELNLALDILMNMLMNMESSPLKRALMDKGIAQNTSGSFDNSLLQPMISISLNNTDEDKKDEFKRIVFDTLEKLVKEGMDKKLIEACINVTEFNLREGNSAGLPKGLLYYLEAMNGWLYGCDPLPHIRYEKNIESIKSALSTDYFEKLIDKYLLKNNHCTLTMVCPKEGLGEKRQEEQSKALDSYLKSLDEEGLEKLREQNAKLNERQSRDDTPEELACIPLLSLKDIDKHVKPLEIQKDKMGGVTTLYYDTFTSGISYLDLMFNMKVVKKDELSYVGLLSGLLGRLDAGDMTYSDLTNQVLIHTGGIYTINQSYPDTKNPDEYKAYTECRCKVLTSKLQEALKLISTILSSTSFEDKARIKELVGFFVSRITMSMLRNGHMTSLTRVMSYCSPLGMISDKTSGLDYYMFLKDLRDNFDEKIDSVVEKLKEISSKLFTSENLTIMIAGKKDEKDKLKENIHIITDSLKGEKQELNEWEFAECNKDEGLLTSSDVQYVARGYNFKKLGYDYNGSLMVLKTILSSDYMWNRIRVKGGAYGAMISLSRNGNFAMLSYRDPNLSQTLKVYDDAYKYLEAFDVSEREMVKYILGTISTLDSPLNPNEEAVTALNYYLGGITTKDREKERHDVLHTDIEDIKKTSKMIKEIMDKKFTAVLGNEAKIKSEADLFKNFISL